MMRRVRRGVGLLCLVTLAACGGGTGQEEFLGDQPTPDPLATPGPRGDAAIIEFVAPDETDTSTTASATLGARTIRVSEAEDGPVFRAEIGPAGSNNPQSSLITFRVLNAAGRPCKNGLRVHFTLEGPADAALSVTEAETVNGFVATLLIAGQIPGSATVVASVHNSNLVARSAAVAIASPRTEAVAIEFVTLRVPDLQGKADDEVGTPRTRSQLGLRGSGVNQSIDAVFLVLDAHGVAALDGTPVDFSLFGPNGGEFVDPLSATSHNGFVVTTIHTGTRPGPVQIEARVRGTTISARAIPLSIGGGLNPPASNLSIAAQCLNLAGSALFGLTDDIRAGVSDQFNNPIPLNSAISFYTEGGGITVNGVTNDRLSATATLVTQLPIPADRRITVLAVTTGQENFSDVNSNGAFDVGEPFIDLGPEPFVDNNESGVWDPGEFFVDQNNNGLFDGAGNGVWDDQILISAAIPIIFSGVTVAAVEPESFTIPPGGTAILTLFVGDSVGNPIVGGSTIKIEGTNVEVAPKEITIPDTDIDTTDGPVPGLTQFTIVLTAPASTGGGGPNPQPTPSGPQAASVTITIESKVQTGEQNSCPGGNGSVTLTVPGVVG